MQLRFNSLDGSRIWAASFFAMMWLATPTELLAQTHDIVRGGGGYLSPLKLGLIIIIFLVWVRLADWVNRDTMKIGELTKLQSEVWNPINVVVFLIGFFSAISVPIFWVGFPIYVLMAFLPPGIYWMTRRGKIKENPTIGLKASAKQGEIEEAPPLPQDEGANVEFIPAGDDKKTKQVALIRARQTPEGYITLKGILDHAMNKRSDILLLDYTRDAVVGRVQVDGAWHQIDPMDRVSGDAMLASLKYLAGLNPGDRRSQQLGTCRAVTPEHKCDLKVSTAGTKTGERVQIKFDRKVKHRLNINQLGMWPEMSEKLAGHMNQAGITIISAMPQGGLTSTWQAALASGDRITRDWVGLVDTHETDTAVENITMHRFSIEEGQSPVSIFKAVSLTQPDCFVVPNMVNAETLDTMSFQALHEDRAIITQCQAKSAADALVRTFAISKNREQFAQAVTVVTNQRLLRRLCDTCKVPIPVQPKLIQRLGGDPRTQNSIFGQFVMPPPEQRVDEKGNPIEIPICPDCNGIGYRGRIAAYEILEVNDAIREVLLRRPTEEAIEKAARTHGKVGLINEAYKMVLLGITSIAEIQRVMKS